MPGADIDFSNLDALIERLSSGLPPEADEIFRRRAEEVAFRLPRRDFYPKKSIEESIRGLVDFILNPDGARATRVYVASKCSHAPMWCRLREEVKESNEIRIISTWLDEAGPGQSKDLEDLAFRCLKEAATADAVILYCEEGEILKGALLEAGAALANDVPVYCVGFCPSISQAFRKHPMWHEAGTIGEAVSIIRTRQLQRLQGE